MNQIQTGSISELIENSEVVETRQCNLCLWHVSQISMLKMTLTLVHIRFCNSAKFGIVRIIAESYLFPYDNFKNVAFCSKYSNANYYSCVVLVVSEMSLQCQSKSGCAYSTIWLTLLKGAYQKIFINYLPEFRSSFLIQKFSL